MWAALVVSIDPMICVKIIGGVAVLYGIWPAGSSRQLSFLLGTVIVGGSLVFSPGVGSTPNRPTPIIPGPVRPVDPLVIVPTDFSKIVVKLFTGSTAEAQSIAAICDQYANDLEFDGNRQNPRIKTTDDLGADWAELQRYRGTSETPWGDRFAPLEQFASDQLVAKGILPEGSKQAKLEDGDRREKAIKFFHELASALLQVRK